MTPDLSNEIDVGALRADTPSCAGVIHLNNAGASPSPDPVHQAVIAHLDLERRIGGYAAAEVAAEGLSAFYDEAAGLLNAQPDEIAFVENATRAWDMAFHALPWAEGDRVLTHGAAEYASNMLAFLQVARRRGIVVDQAPSDETGQVDVAALEAMIGPRTRLIALTHVPTHCGLVNPAEAVGAVARRHDIPYLLDACQSAGQIPLDVQRIGCDMLSATGRKFLRGPRGTGFLYVRRDFAETLDPPMIDLVAARWSGAGRYDLAPGARRFETFERHVAGQIGLGRAIRYARAVGIHRIAHRVGNLADLLRKRLSETPGVSLHDPGALRCGIVSFRCRGEQADVTLSRLAERRILASVSRIEMARTDFEANGLEALVRLSVHAFTTEREVNQAVDVVRR